jgi:hypothetical protein
VSVHRSCGWLAAACLLFVAVCAPAHAALRRDTPYGVHSMVYANAPSSFKDAMFREAAAVGASSVRVDVSVGAIATPERNWSSLDEYVTLARRYRVQVVGVLLGTPWWLARCPPSTPDYSKCPVSDARAYARLLGEIAARSRGVIDDWEIRNEPDGAWAYLGTAKDYGRELRAAAAAIHQANPRARVLMGGVMTLDSRRWLATVLESGAASAIDVANVHVRGPVASLERIMRRWRAFFTRHGVHAPLWVTEHGYPSDSRYQSDRAFRGGERAQAAYLTRSIRVLLRGGAARVFVTERDNLAGSFASEGFLGGSVADPPVADPAVRRKPAADAYRGMIRGYSRSS